MSNVEKWDRTEEFADVFTALCKEEKKDLHRGPGESIGTYKEKRLHRLLKRSLCREEQNQEIKIGRYVADILEGNEIIEIQTGSFYPLVPKLGYYLTQTYYSVTVVHPLIVSRIVTRVDRESGEVLRRRKSPKQAKPTDLLPNLYYLRELLADSRIRVLAVEVYGEEFRYSERRRYCREGVYDSEFVPEGIRDSYFIENFEDVAALLPEELKTDKGFDRKVFAGATALGGKRLNMALGCLVSMGIIEGKKEGRKQIYYRSK